MNLVYLNILKLSFCYYCGPPAVSSWPTRGNCLFKKDRSHYSNLAMKYKTVCFCVYSHCSLSLHPLQACILESCTTTLAKQLAVIHLHVGCQLP